MSAVAQMLDARNALSPDLRDMFDGLYVRGLAEESFCKSRSITRSVFDERRSKLMRALRGDPVQTAS
jgi:hypothetical protein